jgi:hypothetical protein
MYKVKDKHIHSNRFKAWRCQWPGCIYFASHLAQRGMEEPHYYVCNKHLRIFRALRNETLSKLNWKPREYRHIQ